MPAANAAHPTAALCAYLKTTAVNDLTAGRIFRPKLPEAETKHMPRACLVVRRAGGYNLFSGGTLPMGDPRIDFVCYGATALEAEQIAEQVVNDLRALKRCTYEHTSLHWARISGGPMALVDPATSWDYYVISAQVMHAEQAV